MDVDPEAQMGLVHTEYLPATITANPQHPQSAAAQPATTTAGPQTTNPTHPRPPNTADTRPQATSANNDRPRGNSPPSQNAGSLDPQRDEKYGDPSDGLWSMYLTEAEKQDKDVTESWKGDTEGILVFTGLFSATVATFIVESYKQLSPNPGDTTNALLTQLSGQLVNISNGIPLENIAAQRSQPFKPTASAVRVNVLWFLSLVLSLTCALSATLMQQWARRYQELAQRHGAPHRRARMRAYIFDGISKFGMARAIATMPTLLHISVFLFFAGLIDFLSPIDTTVSYFTLSWVVAFALAYAILTILPNLYLDCPYATPLSGLTWRFYQFSMIVVLRAALGIEVIFHNSLLKVWKRGVGWKEGLGNQIKVHRQWLSDGLRKSIERNAKDAPSTVVASALEWTLTALDDDKEIETFAAGVPGFLDSRTVSDVSSAILPLMSEKPHTDAILGSRLYDLLKTCMPGTSPLGDEERNSRLRVCLKCLCYFGRAYNQSGASEPLPSYFPRTIANPEIILFIQAERDPVIRMMGRCFGALVVTKLAAGVKSSVRSNVPISDEELACLSAILGTKNHDVKLYLTQSGAVELASMVSLALDDVASLVANPLPSDVIDVVQKTFDILSQALPAEEIVGLPVGWANTQINTSGGEFDHIIISRLRDPLQMCISGSSPLTGEVRRSCLRMCLKSLWYHAKAYHQLGASEPLPSYFPHVLSTPEITRDIEREGDRASRVIGYCFEALVVVKLAADFNSGIVRAGNREFMACLSANLGAERRMVELWLRQPGAIEHMGLFFLVRGEVGSVKTTVKTSLISVTEQSDVLDDVVQQTLRILFHSLPTGLNAETWSPVHKFDGRFTPILRYWLAHLFETCTISTPLHTSKTRIMCLKSLWYYIIACHHLRALRSLPAFDFFPIDLVTPETARRIRTEEDLDARVIGRCFGSLVINTLGTKFKPFGDPKLAYLSAILGTKEPKAVRWLSQPGAIQLVNIVSLIFGEVGSFFTDTVPSDVLHIVGQTIGTLADALPARLKVELQLDWADALMNVSDSSIKSIIVSHLRALLKTCTLRTLPLAEEVRTSCLQLCLNGLWRWGRVLLQPGASRPLPSEFLDLAGLEITRHIRTEEDQVSRLMGRCVEALVVNNLATRIKLRADSTVQIGDKAEACLAAILGTENRDLRLWLGRPGAVELANMVSLITSEIDCLYSDTAPLDVLDIIQQTFSILSQALPAELNTELGLDQIYAPVDIPDGPTPILGEIYQNHSSRRLKNLWRCVRAYNQPGNSVPLPSHVLIAFASPAVTRRIRTERDVATRVIGRCVEALVVTKLVAGIKSSTDSNVRIDDEELACLSAILGTKSHDTKSCLKWPGVVELASVVCLALGDIGSLPLNALLPDVLDVAQQTLTILFQSLPADETAELRLDQPITQLNISDGKFDRIIVSRLHNLLQMCISNASPLPVEVRSPCLRMCLKSLWYCARAYNQPGASRLLPSYFYLALATPEITRHIQTKKDPSVHAIGRCFEALVISKLVVGIKSRTDSTVQISDEELECLSAILGAENHDVKLWLRLPGTVALANMASLTFNELGSLISDTASSDMRDMIHQTLGILSQSLAELNAEPRLRQTNAITGAHGQFEHIVVSHLYDLFETCTRRIPRLTEEVRQSCLRMCLKSLWNYGRVYHRLGASKLMPSYIPLTLGGLEMTHRIHIEQDHAVRVMGRCVEALMVNNLAARAKSRTDSTVQISDKALACLSAILGTESHDLRNWLDRPGAVELANMVSLITSEIDILFSDTAPSDVLDIIQQTFSILSRTLPAELKTELTNFTDVILPLPEPIYGSRSHMCLTYLWYCARAYNLLGFLVPLPSFVRITLASPKITRHLHTESDLAARVTGRCVWALIVNKLVDDFESRIFFGGGVHDAELAYISSILGPGPDELLRWPDPSAVMRLLNAVSLLSGGIETLFTSGPTSLAVDALNILVQQTINTIGSGLLRGGAFARGDLPLDEVLVLRGICSNIANVQPANWSGNQTVKILQQISKRMPTVEHGMRRCTSLIFDPQSVRGRRNLTTRAEYEARRRRSKSM